MAEKKKTTKKTATKKTAPKKEKIENQRRQIRFYPDENALIEVCFDLTDTQKLGVLYEESSKGCSGIFVSDAVFQQGREVDVQAGRLSKLPAEIKWVKEIYPRLVRVGFIYKA